MSAEGRPFLDRYGFRPLASAGVWEYVPPFGGSIRLILLNQLDEQPHNAPLKVFASRAEERQKAFAAVEASGITGRSAALEQVFIGLWRVFMEQPTQEPKWRKWTAEDLRAMGQDVIRLVANTLTLEEFMRLPAPAAIVRQQLRAQQEAAEKALQQAVEQEREAARKAALEAKTNLLRRQLGKKFGNLPGSVDSQLEAASPEDIELWGERILSAGTIGEVFR